MATRVDRDWKESCFSTINHENDYLETLNQSSRQRALLDVTVIQ